MRGTTVRRCIALIAILLPLTAIITGCASTDIRSQTSPDYRGYPYEKILVWIDIDDALTAHSAEDYLVEELSLRGANAVSQYSVFFAGKDYTYVERQRELDKSGIDAVLTVELTDSGATKHRTPDRVHRVRRVNPYTGRVPSREMRPGAPLAFRSGSRSTSQARRPAATRARTPRPSGGSSGPSRLPGPCAPTGPSGTRGRRFRRRC